MKNENIPEVLADRYKVIEKLGSGGMGLVFLAHDPILGIDVAIKILTSDSSGLTSARLQREAMAAGKLNHPNIAKVLDFGQTTDAAPYMVMEYIKGKSLADLIKEKGVLSFTETKDIFVQICQGLSVAHSHQIIHRDLKPSNIMVIDYDKPQKLVKLLDFGVAKLEAYSQELTRTGILLGSPLYMSPEQAQGDEADSRSDIYSFGCLMFECLTGDTPFRGQTALETISQHKSKAPPLISEVAFDINFPSELCELVDSCLSKSPSARPQSATDLLERIKDIGLETKNQTDQKKLSDIPVASEPKTVFGHSLALVTMVATFSLAFLVFVGVMISASIKTQNLKQENEIIAKSSGHSTERTGLQETSNREMVTMLSNRKSKEYDGSSSTVVKYELEDSDFELLDKDTDNLDVSRSGLRKEQLVNLSKLKIKSLVLNGKELDDSSIKYLTRMKTLEKLTCGETQLTDLGFAELSKFPRLTSLAVSASKITPQALLSLKELPNLNHLQIECNNLDDTTPLYLSKLQALSLLSLKSNKFTDEGYAQLKQIPKLQSITVNSPLITDKSFTFLKDMKKLEWAGFERCNLSPDFAVNMRIGKAFYLLTLIQQRPMSTASAKALAKSPIITLNLMNTPIFDEQLIALSESKKLYTLNIGNSPVTIKGIKSLKSPPLAVLYMVNYRNLNDEIIKKISELKFLHSLYLSHTNINDEQLMTLAQLPNLQNLGLDGCPGLSPRGAIDFEALFLSLHKRKCNIHTANVVARDLQEGDNFEKGKKNWRVKMEE